MDNQKFRIVLSGRLIEGFEQEDVALALSQLLKLPLEQAQRLLMGARSRLLKPLDLDKVEQLKEQLIRLGADCSIEPVREKVIPVTDDCQISPLQESLIDPADVSKEAGLDAPVISELAGGDSLELDLPQSPALDINDTASLDDLDLDLPDELDADVNSPKTEVMLGGEPAPVGVEQSAPPVGSSQTQAHADAVDDSGHEQFFEQPEIIQVDKPVATGFEKKRVAIYSLTALVLLVCIIWVALPMWSDQPSVDSASKPVVQQPPLPQDPQLATSEQRLRLLSRSVKVWMIQFGSGFDPAQVTLERLRQDLEMTSQEMLDGWGTAFRYQPGEGRYRVISAGKDHHFDTSDDLIDEVKIQ